MRSLVTCAFLFAVGCGGLRPLPTTLSHLVLAPGVEPTEADWLSLARGDSLVARTDLGDGDCLLWATRDEGAVLLRVRRTELGLEVQSRGVHHGSVVRPALHGPVVAGVRFVVVESSTAPSSTERDAWIYAEHGSEIVPLRLDGGPGRIRLRAERRSPLEHGWSRVSTLTATFDVDGGALVVHEHESVRELADDRPELPARGTYDVERARRLLRARAELTSDRPSLFD